MACQFLRFYLVLYFTYARFSGRWLVHQLMGQNVPHCCSEAMEAKWPTQGVVYIRLGSEP